MSWPLHKTWFWERAPFFRLLAPLVAGIVAYEYLPGISLSFIAIVLLVGVLAFGTLLLFRLRVAALNLVLMSCFFAAAGYMICRLNDDSKRNNYFIHNGPEASYLARITSAPQEQEETWKLQMEVVAAAKDGNITTTCGKAFVYMLKGEAPMMLHKGDSVWLPGKWEPVKNAGNPFEFDHAAYCRHNGIGYTQFCTMHQVRLAAAGAQASFTDRTHDWSMQQLNNYIPDKRTLGLLQAMLLGDEVNLDPDLRQLYADTGIVHVIAISGSNVLLFFALISVLLRWVRHRKYDWLKYLLALPLIWFYVVMAGNSPSAVRAAVMFTLLAAGIVFDKNHNALNQLFATTFVLLVVQPAWLYSMGFQLSFVAVLSLIIFYAPIRKLLQPKRWLPRKIWEAVAASAAAEILVAPLVIYYFHNFPVFFLVANVLAFLFMEIVLLLAVAVIVTSFFAPLAALLGQVAIWLANTFHGLMGVLQGWGPVSFKYLSVSFAEMLLVYAFIAAVTLSIQRRNKRSIVAALAVLCILLTASCIDEYRTLQADTLIVYDAGRQHVAEHIADGAYANLHADSAAMPRISKLQQPAHVHYQSWKALQEKNGAALMIGGHPVVLLDSPVFTGRFPADYVVINYDAGIDIGLLAAVFRPKTIVISGSHSSRMEQRWQQQADSLHTSLWLTRREGAFVLR